jgi:hypothetical protein
MREAHSERAERSEDSRGAPCGAEAGGDGRDSVGLGRCRIEGGCLRRRSAACAATASAPRAARGILREWIGRAASGEGTGGGRED